MTRESERNWREENERMEGSIHIIIETQSSKFFCRGLQKSVCFIRFKKAKRVTYQVR